MYTQFKIYIYNVENKKPQIKKKLNHKYGPWAHVFLKGQTKNSINFTSINTKYFLKMRLEMWHLEEKMSNEV
jgi:hypothetical protein